jgi:DNA-binding transcriptional ArsR family regulator
MSKSNFLLVDLNEIQAKKLAETITSDTSRKIFNHLADYEQDTELNISKALTLPISTVHYHLQKLMEAKLIEIPEFHYSVKGREINHYKLANKYIIIAPKMASGLKQKLRGLLPVTLAAVGISAVIKIFQPIIKGSASFTTAKIAQEASSEAVLALDSALSKPAQLAGEAATPLTAAPDLALWFLISSLVTIMIYLLIEIIREKALMRTKK